MERTQSKRLKFADASLKGYHDFCSCGASTYSLGTELFGTSNGPFIGAHYSHKMGNCWTKGLFFVMVLVIEIRLMTQVSV